MTTVLTKMLEIQREENVENLWLTAQHYYVLHGNSKACDQIVILISREFVVDCSALYMLHLSSKTCL